MEKRKLTRSDIASVNAVDSSGNGDRTGAYVLLWQLTGSSQALVQARISSFSGGEGGAAFYANLLLQRELGAAYPGVFDLSQQVFVGSMSSVADKLDNINAGKVDLDHAIFDGARDAWNAAHLKHDFPGNLYSSNPFDPHVFLNGEQFSHGSGVAAEGATVASLFGKSLSDFDGKRGFSMLIVTDYAGQKLVTVKDNKTGKTVFVGNGGDLEQRVADAFLQSTANLLSTNNVLKKDQLEVLKILRQNEESCLILIDVHGNIKFTGAAKQFADKTPGEIMRALAAQSRAAAAAKPVSIYTKVHRALRGMGTLQRSYAPRDTRGQAHGQSGASRHLDGKLSPQAFGGSASSASRFVDAGDLKDNSTAHGLPKENPVVPDGKTGHGTPMHRLSAVTASPLKSIRVTPDGRYMIPTDEDDGDDWRPATRGEIYQAFDEFFERQARLAPASGGAFDPTLTPAWAGWKMGF